VSFRQIILRKILATIILALTLSPAVRAREGVVVSYVTTSLPGFLFLRVSSATVSAMRSNW